MPVRGSAQALDVRGDGVDLLVGHRACDRRASSDSDRSGACRRDRRAAARRRRSRADRAAPDRAPAGCRRPSGRGSERTPATPLFGSPPRIEALAQRQLAGVSFQARRLLRREVRGEVLHVVVGQARRHRRHQRILACAALERLQLLADVLLGAGRPGSAIPDSRCCRSAPWQATQAVDLDCPSSAEPAPSAAALAHRPTPERQKRTKSGASEGLHLAKRP